MSSRDNRDTLLAFYGTYDEDPSASEPPKMPSSATHLDQETLQQPSSTNNSASSSSSSSNPSPSDAASAGHRQPSQYTPGSRAKSIVASKPAATAAAHTGPVFPSALQPAKQPSSSPDSPPSYTNPFTDPPSAETSPDPTQSTFAFDSAAHSRPSMDSPRSPYHRATPPNSGKPMLSVDPQYARSHSSHGLQQPPRAAFGAPPSPAMSSNSTLIGSAPPSPAFAKSPTFMDRPNSPSRDNDRFAPSERPDAANDFWKRFSMVVKESENEKSGAKSGDWLSKQNKKTKTYKRWIALVALLIIAIIVGVVCYVTLKPDDGDSNSHTKPSEHDFGLGVASVASLGEDKLVRRATAAPRAFGEAGSRAFHQHQRRRA